MIGFRALVLALVAVIASAPIHDANARGGTVSLTLSPQGRDGDVVREGLQLYSMIKGWKSRGNRANVDQRGTGNGAAIGQHGDNNVAEVVQRGNGHSATVTQSGRNNWLGLFQFGRNATENVNQTGNGKTDIVIQGGF
jgi:hypothetical protein